MEKRGEELHLSDDDVRMVTMGTPVPLEKLPTVLERVYNYRNMSIARKDHYAGADDDYLPMTERTRMVREAEIRIQQAQRLIGQCIALLPEENGVASGAESFLHSLD